MQSSRPSAARRRGTPQSLAGHLTRTLVIWIGGAWLLGVLAVVWYVDSEINHNFDSELAEVSHRMFDIAAGDLDDAERAGAPAYPLLATPPLFKEDAVIFQVANGHGKVLMRSEDAPLKSFDVPLVPGYANAGKWRIYTVKHPTRDLYLQLADPLDERRTTLNRTLLGLIIPLAAVLPLLGLLLRGIARNELRPLQWLAGQIAQRSGTDLRPITLPGLPQELATVSDGVNNLLARLEHSLDVERALAANAAHELRTPLTAARLRLQTALEHDLRREDVQAALDALQVLSHRTEKLLQLSRAESGASFTRNRLDLVQLTADVAQEFWRDDQIQPRLDLRVPDEHIPPAMGDLDSLAIALRNLVENALRYSGGHVVLEVRAPCTLVVRDNGRGVTPAQLATLQGRHVRHSSDVAGYGLGLSIVNTIVTKHAAQLELESPLPGQAGGFEARIVLRPAE